MSTSFGWNAERICMPKRRLPRGGTSTHSSMPRPDNAIFALAKALSRLANYETPVQLTPSTRRFFTTLANTSTPPLARSFRDLLGTDTAAAIP